MDKCYNCGEAGHYATTCPAHLPAASRDEHQARIATLVRRWQDGEISVEDKRRLIAAENETWRSARAW